MYNLLYNTTTMQICNNINADDNNNQHRKAVLSTLRTPFSMQ